MAEHSVESFDATPIWFSDSGGDGATVVLLHAATLTSVSNFHAYYEPSEDGAIALVAGPTVHGRLVDVGARVVCVDARGHGRSGRSLDPERYRGDAHARDVMAVLEHLGVEQMHLVGYSMGSLTAMRLFSLDDRIASAALCGTGLHFLEGHADANTASLGEVGRWLQSNPWADDPVYAWVRDLVELDDVHDFGSIGAALIGLEPLAPARIRDAEFPVLVLNGGGDDGDAAGLASMIPEARSVVAGSRDHPTAYCDADFQQVLVDFISGAGTQHASSVT